MIDIFALSDEAFEKFMDAIDNLTIDDIPVIEKLLEV